MFSGIIQAVGNVRSLQGGTDAARLDIASAGLDRSDIALGDSIAVNGVCLTAIALADNGFQADVSKETLACVTPLREGDEVNLEKALRFSDRLGGHLVSGHVDGIGQIVSVEEISGNRVVAVQVPDGLSRYVARKGSIAIHGVSLTINEVHGSTFLVNLIPHTLDVTILKYLGRGDLVNLEVDMIARYVERLNSQE
jgi:riboflavin synthase